MKGDFMSVLGLGLRSFLAICCLLAGANAHASNEAVVASYDFISTGERLELKDGDFSIVPPVKWEVFKNHPSLTLLMQVAHNQTLKYQRTIQVASFSGNKYIDEVTAREFEGIIVNKFSHLTSSIEEYKVREHRVVDMEDGRDGILFYTEFQLEGISMMQAHILLSSSSRHYLMTFTDLADHFEKEEYSQYLNEAWASMISVELSGGGAATFLKKIGLGQFKRFQSLIYIGFAAIGLMLTFFLFQMFRKTYSGNRLSDYSSDGGRDDDLSDDGTMHSQMQSTHQESRRMTGADDPITGYPSNMGALSHSQPANSRAMTSKHVSSPATRGPKTGHSAPESRLQTAEADDEDTGMDTFFDDEDEDDKAI